MEQSLAIGRWSYANRRRSSAFGRQSLRHDQRSQFTGRKFEIQRLRFGRGEPGRVFVGFVLAFADDRRPTTNDVFTSDDERPTTAFFRFAISTAASAASNPLLPIFNP